MTNFEFMKTIPDENTFVKWLDNQYYGFCNNQPKDRKRCFQDDYRGRDGCKKCKIDWLKSEITKENNNV